MYGIPKRFVIGALGDRSTLLSGLQNRAPMTHFANYTLCIMQRKNLVSYPELTLYYSDTEHGPRALQHKSHAMNGLCFETRTDKGTSMPKHNLLQDMFSHRFAVSFADDHHPLKDCTMLSPLFFPSLARRPGPSHPPLPNDVAFLSSPHIANICIVDPIHFSRVSWPS